jgi:hypothetical protein
MFSLWRTRRKDALCAAKSLQAEVRDLAEKLYPGGREREQDFVYQIPLVEVIAEASGLEAAQKRLHSFILKQ